MNVPAKLGLYGLGLVVALSAAVGAGRLAGPLIPDPAAGEGSRTEHSTPVEQESSGTDHAPVGLQVSQNGYTLDLVEVPAEADEEQRLAFRVLGAGGDPVTGFTESHGKRMHLIVVGRDMSGYRHVHPELAADGTWSVPMELDTPGVYRMFADFVPEGGDALTLGTDLQVPGDYAPQPLPEPTRTAEVDGYTVTLDGGLVPGRTSELTFTVTKDGEAVTDLQPYLTAYGHLVALRDGDLAYLHVHPEGGPGDGATEPGPGISFQAEAPSAGDYRLFLDFKHGDQVRTVGFTVTAGANASTGDDGGTDHGDPAHTH